jgi:hypothetical protein
MPIPQGAIQYQCTCGAKYLIAFRGESDAEWFDTVDQVARSLGVDVIDSTLPSFTCRGCGEIHLRADVRATVPTDFSWKPRLAGSPAFD